MAGKRSQTDRLISGCNSWADFTTELSRRTPKEKGDAFERLTQLYLQTKPEYQTKLNNVWLLEDIPKRARQNLSKLPNPDEGIDLVAETREGGFWAIQCKYKTDSHKTLTVTELSTFTNLAFNACAGQFSQAVVAHTSSKPVKKRKLLGRTTEIGLQRWLEITPEHWKLIHDKLEKKSTRPKKRSPRPHQVKAIEAAKKHFLNDKQNRGKLLMPCGTGKSLTAFWISRAVDSKTTLVVVPSLSLVKQSVEDWTQEFVAQGVSPLPEWLCVCSDESVGNVSKDEFVGEIYDLGLPVTTDPEEVKQFLRKRTKANRVIFVTYQSSPVFANAARSAKRKIDLAIFDEAHKTAGEKSKSFSTLLFDENTKIDKRMFMTATERVMRGSHDDVVSMDKREVYGNVIYHLSFKDAIHSDPAIISDYKVLTVFVTEKEIEDAIRDQSFVTDFKAGIEAEDARYIATGIALRKSYKKYKIKHAVSFHRSIRAASDFSDLQDKFNNVKNLRPKIESFHISSKKTAGQRTQLLKDFANSPRSLITNARCLTEGVDVPAIDCVLFADPKQSTIDIVQAAGRALRPYQGKECGYIMLPIVVPDGKTFDEFAETTEFRDVSKVITALSTQDERIAEEFRLNKNASSRRGSIIQFSGTIPVGSKLGLKEFADAISAKVWERVAKINWRPFAEAREFARSLNLKSRNEWKDLAKTGGLPKDIPAHPNEVYKDQGWDGWGDFLGTGSVAPINRVFRPFDQAREFARSLNLKSGKEWNEFSRSGELPEDIPRAPDHTYKDQGWKSIGDWLGTGTVASFLREYRPFDQAREFARSLNLKSRNDWSEFTKSGELPKDIPAHPNAVYKDQGWDGWGDFLGTGSVATFKRVYRSFEDAREFARSLKLKAQREWNAFTKSGNFPEDIPAGPHKTYKDQGWKGMGDWLGTGTVASFLREYRPFDQAREFARSLNLKSRNDWSEFTKSGELPKDIPAHPNAVYKDQGWDGWGDFLGTGSVAPINRVFRPFEEARAFAQSLNLKSGKEWSEFTKSGELPEDIPAIPHRTYKDQGWKGIGDWLGTGNVANMNRVYRSFEAAREFAQSLDLKSGKEWKAFTKSGALPEDIPARPNRTHKDQGWISMGDWLGTGNVANMNRVYRSFEAAREFARSLNLKSGKEWNEFSRSGELPEDIPAGPHRTYKDQGWKSMGDWLGTGTVASCLRVYRPFDQAREFARSLNLKSRNDWSEFTKSGELPEDIPANPYQTYKDQGWKSIGDWLGTGTVASCLRVYRPFDQAREFARSLNLKSGKEWRAYTKSGEFQENIPRAPNQTYKDQGWKGMGDWLGTGTVASRNRVFRPFDQAREFARSLNLKSAKEWNEFSRSGELPEDIPAGPHRTYKDQGWKGIGDWLGTGNVASYLREYRPFDQAREFARSLNLKSRNDWREFTKSGEFPEDIPRAPDNTYKDQGWKGMGDWLGTGTVASFLREYRPFDQAREFARSLNLKSRNEWKDLAKTGGLPKDIPAHPNAVYKDQGWDGWGDFLGTGSVAPINRVFRSFEAAREFVQSLDLKSGKEWKAFTKSGALPEDIPANPYQTYKDQGWKSIGDWLGTGTVASFLREYRPFDQAREFAQSLDLKSGKEWKELAKSGGLPEDIPADPYGRYKDQGWKGWGDWLGTKTET